VLALRPRLDRGPGRGANEFSILCPDH